MVFILLIPGVAFTHSNDCEICALYSSMLLDHIYRILWACWSESTTWRKHRWYKISI